MSAYAYSRCETCEAPVRVRIETDGRGRTYDVPEQMCACERKRRGICQFCPQATTAPHAKFCARCRPLAKKRRDRIKARLNYEKHAKRLRTERRKRYHKNRDREKAAMRERYWKDPERERERARQRRAAASPEPTREPRRIAA